MQFPVLPQRGEVITKIRAPRRAEQELLGASGIARQPKAELTAATESTTELISPSMSFLHRILGATPNRPLPA